MPHDDAIEIVKVQKKLMPEEFDFFLANQIIQNDRSQFAIQLLFEKQSFEQSNKEVHLLR